MNSLTKPDDHIAPAELLKSYIEWGVDETITEEPINWFSETDNIYIKQYNRTLKWLNINNQKMKSIKLEKI